MNSTMHTVAIAVLAAIIGGVGGAALTNSRNASADAEKISAQTVPAPDTAPPALTQEQIDQIAQVAADAAAESLRMQTEANAYQTSATARARGRSSARRVYYDYATPRPAVAYTTQNQGSFWQRHRDILTVAIGTGIGAAIGAGTGGKKGALIGAGVGAGGSALYTYALRNRNNGY
jgi:hypothetical protein